MNALICLIKRGNRHDFKPLLLLVFSNFEGEGPGFESQPAHHNSIYTESPSRSDQSPHPQLLLHCVTSILLVLETGS
jgi:hypothetical protein